MTTTPEETHMPTDPAHRALLRAIDGLTTQVRRIADTLETPVTTDDDGTQTTGADAPAAPAMPFKMCSASAEAALGGLLGPCILRYQHCGPLHQDAEGSSWSERLTAPPTSGAEKQRTIRRQQFRILLNQLNDGTTPLTTAQVQSLTAYVADEIVECNMETQEADRQDAELEQAKAAINRVRTALDDRPALCTDSVYERGWNDAAEMIRHALAGPTTEG
ncbi:hypothetical protein ACFV07_07890 [Streptomyces anulatus]|uniref:hypothetical protein n=1 Tax=Streptomyces anulatus TaxID=1892 RepID=UPI00369C1BEC